MKKEIISLFAVIALFSGCEHVNQPQTATNNTEIEKKEVVQESTNVALDMKKELAEFYNIWKNTKYKAGGTNKRGIDSAALTQLFFKDRLDLNIPRRAYQQSRAGIKVNKQDLEMGDIIILKRKKEFYTGVYMGENEFIHSSFKGVKIEKLDKSPYKNIYHSARRVF
ncbi:NlpC/P60 family protein [Arcobacter sp. LA11]|uniref:NlpC/P60 family protein n=1 Tax=Arcobacter sp. LA11 TaxID=1898176 RepID=UPI0009351D9C|nr:NlpC/P60 family protein [Arcobacter sp. LA11]